MTVEINQNNLGSSIYKVSAKEGDVIKVNIPQATIYRNGYKVNTGKNDTSVAFLITSKKSEGFYSTEYGGFEVSVSGVTSPSEDVEKVLGLDENADVEYSSYQTTKKGGGGGNPSEVSITGGGDISSKLKSAMEDPTISKVVLSKGTYSATSQTINPTSNTVVESIEGAKLDLTGTVITLGAGNSNLTVKGIDITEGEIYNRGKNVTVENCILRESLVRGFTSEGLYILNCTCIRGRYLVNLSPKFVVRGGSMTNREALTDSEDMINIQNGSHDVEISKVAFNYSEDIPLEKERNIIYAWGSGNIRVKDNILNWKKNTVDERKNFRFKNCFDVLITGNTFKTFTTAIRIVATSEQTDPNENKNIIIENNICEDVDMLAYFLNVTDTVSSPRAVRDFHVRGNQGGGDVKVEWVKLPGEVNHKAKKIIVLNSENTSLINCEGTEAIEVTFSKNCMIYNPITPYLPTSQSSGLKTFGGKVGKIFNSAATATNNTFQDVDITSEYDGYQSVGAIIRRCAKPPTIKNITSAQMVDWISVAKTNGTTAERPATPPNAGFMFFDTTLGIPIFWKTGTVWVDSTGTAV